MALATLSIDLVAKLAQLESDFSKATHLAQKNAADIANAYKATRDTLVSVGKSVAAAFTIGAIVSFVKTSIDAADHLNDLSKATQLSVEEIGGIGFAAKQAGTDMEGASVSIGKLNLAIAKAAAGDKGMAATFKSLGIEVRDASGHVKDSSTVLGEISSKFATYAEGPNKAALAQAIFGKSYQSILPLLADGGEELRKNIDYFKQFGGVTTESAKAADQFNDTIGKIELIAQGSRNEIVNGLLPGLQAVADELLHVKENGEGMSVAAEGIRILFETVTVLGANVVFVLTTIGKEMGGFMARWQVFVEEFNMSAGSFAYAAIKQKLTGIQDIRLSKFTAVNDAVDEDTKRALKTLEDFEARVMQTGKVKISPDALAGFAKTAASFGGQPAKAEAPGLPDSTKATRTKTSEIEKYIQKLNEETLSLITTGDAAGVAEKAMFEFATNPKFATATEAQKNAVLELARGIDQLNAKPFDAYADSRKRASEADAEATAFVQAQTDAFNALIAATPTAQLEATRREMMRLGEAFEAGIISAEQFTEAAQTRLGTLPSSFAAVATEMQVIAADIRTNVDDAIGESVLASFSDSSKSILDIWINLLQKMVAQALTAQLSKALLGDFGKEGGSAMGGFLGFVVKGVIGAFTPDAGMTTNLTGGSLPTAGGKAGGGAVNPFSRQPVNELGPELLSVGGQDMLMMGSRGGHVTPNSLLGGGANITFQIASGVSRNEVAAMVPSLTAHIKAELLMTMRRPGYQR